MQGQQDLNPQPTVLETATLPIELCPYLNLIFANCEELASGIEPPTSSLPRKCSTAELHQLNSDIHLTNSKKNVFQTQSILSRRNATETAYPKKKN